MGFIQKRDDEDEDLGSGQNAVTDPSRARGWSGLPEDLDLLVCPECRRELLPWQERCPDHGAEGIPREQLPPPRDPVLERLLRDNPDLADGLDEDG